jgi:hypothetical protein
MPAVTLLLGGRVMTHSVRMSRGAGGSVRVAGVLTFDQSIPLGSLPSVPSLGSGRALLLGSVLLIDDVQDHRGKGKHDQRQHECKWLIGPIGVCFDVASGFKVGVESEKPEIHAGGQKFHACIVQPQPHLPQRLAVNCVLKPQAQGPLRRHTRSNVAEHRTLAGGALVSKPSGQDRCAVEGGEEVRLLPDVDWSGLRRVHKWPHASQAKMRTGLRVIWIDERTSGALALRTGQVVFEPASHGRR